MDAIKKTKHVLTGNKESSISLDCLFEDYDFHTSIQRDMFDNISKHLYAEFENCLKNLIGKLSKNQNLHSVEIIGGATRMPKLQQIIVNILKSYKIEQCSRTLNADESIAKGCSLQSAF